MVIGIISINYFAERNERQAFVLIVGAIIILIQQILLWIIKRRNRKSD